MKMAKPGAEKKRMMAQWKKQRKTNFKGIKLKKGRKKGCYVATCVYGSYDCPEVWVLRRFRDNVLDHSLFGKAFIKLYYLFSPIIVSVFGKSSFFKRFWRKKLDAFVKKLKKAGFSEKPYQD